MQLFADKKGAIMKVKAGAVVGVFILSGPLTLFAASATEPHGPTSLSFRHAGDHEVKTATNIEKPKLISSLKVPTLQAESRIEKRSTPSAEPQETLCGLKGVMVFIEDIDSDVEKHGLQKISCKKRSSRDCGKQIFPCIHGKKLMAHRESLISI